MKKTSVILLANLRNKDCKATELGFLLKLLPVRIDTFVETLGSHLEMVLTFEFVNEILKFDHSDESY